MEHPVEHPDPVVESHPVDITGNLMNSDEEKKQKMSCRKETVL